MIVLTDSSQHRRRSVQKCGTLLCTAVQRQCCCQQPRQGVCIVINDACCLAQPALPNPLSTDDVTTACCVLAHPRCQHGAVISMPVHGRHGQGSRHVSILVRLGAWCYSTVDIDCIDAYVPGVLSPLGTCYQHSVTQSETNKGTGDVVCGVGGEAAAAAAAVQ